MTPVAPEPSLRSLLEELAAARGKLGGRAGLAVVERSTDLGEMSPLHVHDEPEAFHVLEGSLTLFVGDEVVRLEAGESLLAPAGVPHAHRAESEAARHVSASFVRSVELYQSFLRAVARPLPASMAHEDERVVTTIAAANGIDVLGPPGALPAASLAA